MVPINSASKFGLIYKSPNFSETHTFETVEDLLLASPLPKIVSALVAHQGQDEHTSVHKSEVLVIKGILWLICCLSPTFTKQHQTNLWSQGGTPPHGKHYPCS